MKIVLPEISRTESFIQKNEKGENILSFEYHVGKSNLKVIDIKNNCDAKPEIFVVPNLDSTYKNNIYDFYTENFYSRDFDAPLSFDDFSFDRFNKANIVLTSDHNVQFSDIAFPSNSEIVFVLPKDKALFIVSFEFEKDFCFEKGFYLLYADKNLNSLKHFSQVDGEISYEVEEVVETVLNGSKICVDKTKFFNPETCSIEENQESSQR